MRDTHTNKTNSDGRDHSLMDATRLDYSPLQQYLEALHRNLRDCAEGGVASSIPELFLDDPG